MSRVAAFFDIDHTILEVNSGRKWIGHLWDKGELSVLQAARSLWWLFEYRLSLLDFDAMARKIISNYAGQHAAPIEQEVRAWFDAEIAEWICTEARHKVEHHRDEGHDLVILTSATRYLSTPVAEALGIEDILCTEVEVVDGVLTGEPIPPLCYGEGKVEKAETYAADRGVDLDASFFYTDSYSDLPMLLRVGEPRVVNPDVRLRRHAASAGWGVEQWSAPGPSA